MASATSSRVTPASIAAYSLGGPTLLVQTVESLSGLTVDHYVEVGMGGVSQMVEVAVFGIPPARMARPERHVCLEGK